VNVADLVLFDEHEDPYKMLARADPNYSSRKMVKCALHYITTGEVEDSFKWSEWLEESWISLNNEQNKTSFMLEGRRRFYNQWSKLMDDMRLPAIETLKIGPIRVGIYELYCSVMKKGGMEYVTEQQLWNLVYEDLNVLSFLTRHMTHLKTYYRK
jgi:hypothetical protein